MNGSLEPLVNPAFVYRFTQGPDVVRSIDDARAGGLNCVALAHLAMQRLFDYHLPPELKCVELYGDRDHFRAVEDIADAQEGDLAWFGLANPQVGVEEFRPVYSDGQLANWREFPVTHVGVFADVSNGDPRILHATPVEGTNTVLPLSEFAGYKRYERLYGITRLMAADSSENHADQNGGWYPVQDLNLQPSAPEADVLSS